MQEKRIHEVFQASVLLKGVFAAIECLSGLALAVASPAGIRSLVDRLAEARLIEGRGEFIAGHLLAWTQTFSVQSQHFYAFYLLSHGAVKLAVVVGLLMGRLWAYPASLVVLTLFVAYQLYRYSYTHSLGLIALTLFDLVVIALIWHEYRLIRRHLPVK